MRFLVDMPLSPSLAAWLADRGHDAVHAIDLGLDELGGVRGKLVEAQAVATLIYPEILSGDKALPPQLVEHGNMIRRPAWAEMEAAEG